MKLLLLRFSLLIIDSSIVSILLRSQFSCVWHFIVIHFFSTNDQFRRDEHNIEKTGFRRDEHNIEKTGSYMLTVILNIYVFCTHVPLGCFWTTMESVIRACF
jgi:hypothetical protein